MSTAVLIGGAGFIGRHLAQVLAETHGYDVVIADLAGPAELLSRSSFVHCDVRSSISAADFPSAPDLVVNLAAVHREPGHEAHEYYDTNVDGAKHVVALCDDLGAENLVFVSSISVYGPTKEALSDDATPAPTTHYGRSKLQAEEIHRAWRREAPTRRRLTVVRPAVIYGPGEGGNFTRLGQALQGHRFVYPGRRDALKASGYVIDMVRSIEFMQRQAELEVTYNFASQHTHTLQEICEAFCRVAGRRPPRWSVPLRPMLWAGALGDRLGPLGRTFGLSRRRVEKLVGSTNVKADRLGRSDFAYEFDLEAALRDWFHRDPVGEFV